MSTRTKSEAPAPLLMSIKSAAKFCDVHPRTIIRWIAEGKIEATKAFGNPKVIRDSIYRAVGEAA